MDITTLVRFKIREYLNLLNELERLIPPYGPKRFAKALLSIIRAMEDFYQIEIENSLVEGGDGTYIQQISEKYLIILQKIHSRPMQFLQRGDEQFVPSEILMTLKRVVDQLSDGNVNFSLSPQWDYMYGFFGYKDIVKYFLEDIAFDPSFIEQLQKEQPEIFVFVTYPYVEHRNILLHSIMIHELGHLFDRLHGITDALEKEITLDQTSFEQNLSKIREIRLGPAPVGDVALTGQITLEDILGKSIETEFKKDCIQVVRSWLKEVSADMLSVHALGPAYVFAVNEFFTLITNLDQYSGSHPSSRLRMKFLLDELEEIELNYFSELNNGVIKDKLFELRDLAKPEYIFEPAEGALKVAYKTIINYIDMIRERVRTYKPYSYGVKTFNGHVGEYVNKYLSKGIPKADIWNDDKKQNIDVNIVSIINAGWQLYLTDMDEFYKMFDASSIEEKKQVLNNLYELIMRAIESSQILKSWKGGDY